MSNSLVLHGFVFLLENKGVMFRQDKDVNSEDALRILLIQHIILTV